MITNVLQIHKPSFILFFMQYLLTPEEYENLKRQASEALSPEELFRRQKESNSSADQLIAEVDMLLRDSPYCKRAASDALRKFIAQVLRPFDR